MEDVSGASYRSQPAAVAGWLIAGVPIVSSGTQAVARAVGTEVEFWPILGGVSEAIKDVSIFEQMALAFDPSSPLVLALFLLVVAAWLTLGLSLFRPAPIFRDHARLVRGGGLFATTILYGLLFLGGYWPVTREWASTGGPTAVDLTAFIGLPAMVFGGIYVAAKVQPRTTGNRLLNEAERQLDTIEQELDATVNRLSTETDRIVPDIDVSVMDSDPVRKYRQQINDIRSKIEETRSFAENQRELVARELLRDEVEPLAAEPRAEKAESAVREQLADWVNETYGTIRVESSFGRSYTLENHRDYRQIKLSAPGLPKSVSVTELDELAASMTSESIELTAAVDAVNTVETHVRELQNDLSTKDEAFASEAETVRTELDTAFDRIENISGDVGKYLMGIYKQGSMSGVAHAGIISQEYGPDNEPGELERAIELHHDCRFNRASEAAEEAAEKARQLTQVVRFFRRIVLTTDDELPGMDLPAWSGQTNPFFNRELLERGINARLDGVRLKTNWETGRIEYQYQGSQATSTESDPDNDSGEDDQPDYLTNDSVRWLFNALASDRDVATSHDRPPTVSDGPQNVAVEIHKGMLPKSHADPTVMESAADHVASQTELDATVDRNRLPGTLAFEVETNDDVPPPLTEIGATLRDSFQRRTQQNRQ